MTRAALAGALAVAMIAGVAAVLLRGGDRYVVRVEFANANGLRKDFTVKQDGVTVGRVARVQVTSRDTALATLELDDSAAPLGAGARASILPSNLLGEKFVALTSGDLRRPMSSGQRIGMRRSSVPPEIDEVISTLDLDTRKALAIFLAEQGSALVGRRADLAATLRSLPGSLASVRELVSGVAHDSRALGRLVAASDRLLATVTPQRKQLGRLVDNASGTFAALARRESELGDTIRAAPATFTQLRRTLVRLRQAAGPLAGAARGLRSTAPSLTTTLRAVPAVGAAARPAFAELSATTPALRSLAADSLPGLRALQATATALKQASRALRPVSKTAATGINDLLGVVEGWARSIQMTDSSGHVFRVDYLLPASLQRSLAGWVLGLPKTKGKSGENTKRRTPVLPGNTPATRPAAPARPAVSVPDIAAGVAGTVGKATQDVTELLDYLLGK